MPFEKYQGPPIVVRLTTPTYLIGSIIVPNHLLSLNSNTQSPQFQKLSREIADAYNSNDNTYFLTLAWNSLHSKKCTLPSPLKKLFHIAAKAENKRRLGHKRENTKLEVKKSKHWRIRIISNVQEKSENDVKKRIRHAGPAETFSNPVMKIICDGPNLLPMIGIGLFMHLFKSKGG